MDRVEKKIYIYRKDGISSVLSYSAGRAATNLKTMKGSRYNIINIEQEERDRILPEILKKMESETYGEMVADSRNYLPSQAYVYGEKTLPIRRVTEQVPTVVQEKRQFEKKSTVQKESIESNQFTYNVEEIVKTLASKILFESNIENLRDAEKPPRHKLKGELVKKIDDLLDKMYE
jgi:hypothetical protein